MTVKTEQGNNQIVVFRYSAPVIFLGKFKSNKTLMNSKEQGSSLASLQVIHCMLQIKRKQHLWLGQILSLALRNYLPESRK